MVYLYVFLVENEYDGDWTERFIQEIQKRPAIYNNRLPEHSDRQMITRLWHEICAAMVSSWEILSSVEKSKAGKKYKNFIILGNNLKLLYIHLSIFCHTAKK